MPQPHGGSGRGSTASPPRWVKLFGIITIILVLLLVVMMLFGGGSHGPGQHMPSGGLDGQGSQVGQLT